MDNIVKIFRNTYRPEDTIYIYGLSKKTQKIIDNCPEYSIAGLLDGYQSHGELYGKKIISLSEIKDPTVKIVIIAQFASENIIYQRIVEYCSSHGIQIFNLYGENLMKKKIFLTVSDPYFNLNKNMLFNKIYNNDFISFDIFDTLLVRKIVQQEDIFRLIEKQTGLKPGLFAYERKRAEIELSRQGIPCLSDIYKIIKNRMGLSVAQTEKLKYNEIEMEKKILQKRPDIVDALTYACSIGKKVVLLSDMYFSSSQLQELLDSAGIYVKGEIFVSCEHNTDKSDRLFDIYQNKYGPGKYLHIGDRKDVDRDSAKQRGMNVFLLKSPGDMLTISSYNWLANNADTVKKQIQRGLFTAKAFASPFSLYHSGGKIQIRTAHDYAYLFVAPILVEFLEWLTKELYGKNIEQILFVSRDGYLIKQLYDSIRIKAKSNGYTQLPDSKYILTSRTVCIASGIATTDDLCNAINLPFDGNPYEMLLKRFLLHKADCKPFRPDEEKEEYIMAHKKLIFENARRLRKNYGTYLSKLNLSKHKKHALFDFISTGTCQLYLEKLVEMPLQGYYFARFESDQRNKQTLDIQDFMNTLLNEEQKFKSNYFIIEDIIKETSPTLVGFDENGGAVYDIEQRSAKHLKCIEDMQQAVKEYWEDYMLQREVFIENPGLGNAILAQSETDANIHIPDLENQTIIDEFYNRVIPIKF